MTNICDTREGIIEKIYQLMPVDPRITKGEKFQFLGYVAEKMGNFSKQFHNLTFHVFFMYTNNIFTLQQEIYIGMTLFWTV